MVKPVTVSRVQLAEHARAVWCVTPEAGTTLKDVLAQDYWANVAATKLKPGTIIEVMPEDASFWAQLLVMDTGRLAASVKVLHAVKLEADAPLQEAPGDHYIEFKGPKLQWCIVRRSDKSIVKEGIRGKDTALRSLADYERALAA